MANSICLDSDILIDFLRNKKEVVNWIKQNEQNNTLATTIINVFELYSGAYKSNNSERGVAAIRNLIERLRILSFSLDSAERAGRENSRLEKEGISVEKRDLFIGIIALNEGFSIKTNNKKHFLKISGLKII